MEKSQLRYNNDQLISLLQILAGDYNRKPTHRAILADSRLPTHHTYIRRFGTMNEALAIAGLTDMVDDDALHQALKDMVKSSSDITIMKEWRPVGNIIVDLYIEIKGKGRFAIDIVRMVGADEMAIDYVRRLRSNIANSTLRRAKYIQITDLSDLLEFLKLAVEE